MLLRLTRWNEPGIVLSGKDDDAGRGRLRDATRF